MRWPVPLTFQLLYVCAHGLIVNHRLFWSSELYQHTQHMRFQLEHRILPFWLNTSLDTVNGGYNLHDKDKPPPWEKLIVSQARMLWTFSYAHVQGYTQLPHRNYLAAAEHGYRFIKKHFLDMQHKGYYWQTGIRGAVTEKRKMLFGQSYVMYAFVEYYRACGDVAVLNDALELFHVVQLKLHDNLNGGWYDHATQSFAPLIGSISYHSKHTPVEVLGLKSANAHLHWLEALAELYDVSSNETVRAALQEAVHVVTQYFFPVDPANAVFHRHINWAYVEDPRSAGLSYGHNVEAAWLILRAQTVLNTRNTASWTRFATYLQHTIEYGYDHQHGGLYYLGNRQSHPTSRDKVWWGQAELLVALSIAIEHNVSYNHTGSWGYVEILNSLLHFIENYQADQTGDDGVWRNTLSEDGRRVLDNAKAHIWKTGYHDVRALAIFVETFPLQPLCKSKK